MSHRKVLLVALVQQLLVLHLSTGDKITIGTLFRSGWAQTHLAAARVAAEHINKNASILGHHELEIVSVDIEAAAAGGGGDGDIDELKMCFFTNALEEGIAGAKALIGVGYSSDARLVSSLLKNRSLPLLSHAASASEFSNKTIHPYFSRMSPSNENEASILVDAASEYVFQNGTKSPGVMLISCDDTYCLDGAKHVKARASETGIKIWQHLVLPSETFRSDVSGWPLVQNIFVNCKQTRVVVLFTHAEQADEVFKAADHLGEINKTIWVANFDVTTRSTMSPVGLIGLKPASPGNTSFGETIISFWKTLNTTTYPGLNQVEQDLYTQWAFDAVYAVAYALDALYTTNHSVAVSASDLQQEIRTRTFAGLSGQVAFDDNGDRASSAYEIYNLAVQGLNKIGVAKNGIITQLAHVPLVWPGGLSTKPSLSCFSGQITIATAMETGFGPSFKYSLTQNAVDLALKRVKAGYKISMTSGTEKAILPDVDVRIRPFDLAPYKVLSDSDCMVEGSGADDKSTSRDRLSYAEMNSIVRDIAESATENGVYYDKAVAIIGPSYSGSAMNAQKSIRDLDIDTLQISYSTTNPSLTSYNFFARTVPHDNLQADAIMSVFLHLKEKAEPQNQLECFVVACESSYCAGIRDSFLRIANDIGLLCEILESDIPRMLDTKKCTSATSKIPVIILAVTETDVIRLQESCANNKGCDRAIFIGTDSSATSVSLLNNFFATSIGVNRDSPQFKGFRDFWTTSGVDGVDKLDHLYMLATAHDSMIAVLVAIHSTIEAGSSPTNRTAISEQLRMVSFHGASGKIAFDKNLDLQGGSYDILFNRTPTKVGRWDTTGLSMESDFDLENILKTIREKCVTPPGTGGSWLVLPVGIGLGLSLAYFAVSSINSQDSKCGAVHELIFRLGVSQYLICSLVFFALSGVKSVFLGLCSRLIQLAIAQDIAMDSENSKFWVTSITHPLWISCVVLEILTFFLCRALQPPEGWYLCKWVRNHSEKFLDKERNDGFDDMKKKGHSLGWKFFQTKGLDGSGVISALPTILRHCYKFQALTYFRSLDKDGRTIEIAFQVKVAGTKSGNEKGDRMRLLKLICTEKKGGFDADTVSAERSWGCSESFRRREQIVAHPRIRELESEPGSVNLLLPSRFCLSEDQGEDHEPVYGMGLIHGHKKFSELLTLNRMGDWIFRMDDTVFFMECPLPSKSFKTLTEHMQKGIHVADVATSKEKDFLETACKISLGMARFLDSLSPAGAKPILTMNIFDPDSIIVGDDNDSYYLSEWSCAEVVDEERVHKLDRAATQKFLLTRKNQILPEHARGQSKLSGDEKLLSLKSEGHDTAKGAALSIFSTMHDRQQIFRQISRTKTACNFLKLYGKAVFIAPERLIFHSDVNTTTSNSPVKVDDSAADVYSLGVLMYQIFTSGVEDGPSCPKFILDRFLDQGNMQDQNRDMRSSSTMQVLQMTTQVQERERQFEDSGAEQMLIFLHDLGLIPLSAPDKVDGSVDALRVRMNDPAYTFSLCGPISVERGSQSREERQNSLRVYVRSSKMDKSSGQDCELHLKLSEEAPVTLIENAKAVAKIPQEAQKFVFCYPLISSNDEKRSRSFDVISPTFPDDGKITPLHAFLTQGGFVYLDCNDNVVAIKAVEWRLSRKEQAQQESFRRSTSFIRLGQSCELLRSVVDPILNYEHRWHHIPPIPGSSFTSVTIQEDGQEMSKQLSQYTFLCPGESKPKNTGKREQARQLASRASRANDQRGHELNALTPAEIHELFQSESLDAGGFLLKDSEGNHHTYYPIFSDLLLWPAVDIPFEIKDLVSSMLRMNPLKRKSVSEVCTELQQYTEIVLRANLEKRIALKKDEMQAILDCLPTELKDFAYADSGDSIYPGAKKGQGFSREISDIFDRVQGIINEKCISDETQKEVPDTVWQSEIAKSVCERRMQMPGKQCVCCKHGVTDTQETSITASIPKLCFGGSEEAAKGLKVFCGLQDDSVLASLLGDGKSSMQAEFEAHGSLQDLENFFYVCYGVAQNQNDMPAHVKDDIRKGTYHGGSLDPWDYDMGHKGWTLRKFVDHGHSVQSHLNDTNVLAARVYTTSSYKRFNNPLRNHCVCREAGPSQGIQETDKAMQVGIWEENEHMGMAESLNTNTCKTCGLRKNRLPHPFKITVYRLDDALRKLRAVEAQQNRDEFSQRHVLYRGMKDRRIDEEELSRYGGVERSPMSTTLSPTIAKAYASYPENYKGMMGPRIIFEYHTEGLATGTSIGFLSVYPKEVELLYPPLTRIKLEDRVVLEQVELDKLFSRRPRLPTDDEITKDDIKEDEITEVLHEVQDSPEIVSETEMCASAQANPNFSVFEAAQEVRKRCPHKEVSDGIKICKVSLQLS